MSVLIFLSLHYSCRPVSGPYWYGLLLIGGMFLLLTSVLLILYPVQAKYGNAQKSSIGLSRYTDYVGLLAISICFYLAWGVVLPATRPLNLGAVRVVFQVIFIVCSSLLGLLMVLCYCILSESVRKAYCQCCKRSNQSYEFRENPYVTDDNVFAMTPKDEEECVEFKNPAVDDDPPPPDYNSLMAGNAQKETSAAETGPDNKADLGKADLEQVVFSYPDDQPDTDTKL